MKKRDSKSLIANFRSVSPYLDLGLRFALTAVAGGAIGYWIDQKFNSSPLGLIFGVMLGGTAGFINLYHTVMKLTNAEKKQTSKSKKSRDGS